MKNKCNKLLFTNRVSQNVTRLDAGTLQSKTFIFQSNFISVNETTSIPEDIRSQEVRPRVRRWGRSCSWRSPRWSCRSRPAWRHTSSARTQTPSRRSHSASKPETKQLYKNDYKWIRVNKIAD